MTNTRHSVRVMSKLIDKADVEGLQAKAWLTALAFVPKPTSEMVLDVKVIFSQNNSGILLWSSYDKKLGLIFNVTWSFIDELEFHVFNLGWLQGLVDNAKVRDDALLPVSSLINNYCRQKGSCDQDYAVLSVITSFERIIGFRCDASGKNFEKVSFFLHLSKIFILWRQEAFLMTKQQKTYIR